MKRNKTNKIIAILLSVLMLTISAFNMIALVVSANDEYCTPSHDSTHNEYEYLGYDSYMGELAHYHNIYAVCDNCPFRALVMPGKCEFENDVCTYCGFSISVCEHSITTTYTYNGYDGTVSSHITQIKCTICDYVEEDTDFCMYRNGVCIYCSNPCAHLGDFTDENICTTCGQFVCRHSNLVSTLVSTTDDNGVYSHYYSYECPDCDYTSTGALVSCAFENGACKVCGFACPHSDCLTTYIQSPYFTDDGYYHSLLTRCRTCGYYTTSASEQCFFVNYACEVCERECEHPVNEKGVCLYCGIPLACEKHDYEYSSPVSNAYDVNNGYTHNIYFTCKVCGDEQNRTFPCYFVDGVCECEQKCEHLNENSIVATYTIIDRVTHRIVKTCNDCDTTFIDTTVDCNFFSGQNCPCGNEPLTQENCEHPDTNQGYIINRVDNNATPRYHNVTIYCTLCSYEKETLQEWCIYNDVNGLCRCGAHKDELMTDFDTDEPTEAPTEAPTEPPEENITVSGVFANLGGYIRYNYADGFFMIFEMYPDMFVFTNGGRLDLGATVDKYIDTERPLDNIIFVLEFDGLVDVNNGYFYTSARIPAVFSVFRDDYNTQYLLDYESGSNVFLVGKSTPDFINGIRIEIKGNVYVAGEFVGDLLYYKRASSTEYTFNDMILSVFDGAVNTFYSMVNFTVLGVNFATLILGILTLVVSVVIISKLKG